MRMYIIKRHGSNAANQSLTQTMIVGSVIAKSQEDARHKAYDQWTCYNNQHFEAVSYFSARKAEREEADMARGEE